MMVNHVWCSYCQNFREKYTTYPRAICKKCCPMMTVEDIAKLLDCSLHHDIYTDYVRDLPLRYPNNIEGPLFWCTMNNEGLPVRCGTIKGKISDNFFFHQDIYNETKILIVEAVIYNIGIEGGFQNMRRYKQSFKQVRNGKPY